VIIKSEIQNAGGFQDHTLCSVYYFSTIPGWGKLIGAALPFLH
jgi:hypothetical protein